MRKTLICFIIIFMSLPLMAQVKIKEKVEIKPEGKAEFVETGTTADPVKIYTVKGRTVFMEFVVEFTPCTYEFSSRKYIGDIQASLNLYVDGLYEPPLRVQSTSGRANIGIPVVANRSITTSPYFRLNMGTTLGHYPTTCFI
ncbi:MAG: hypothetical protein GXX85_13290 [Ignavibacteria bacterium]|nr:hypothetical protein [Ignavibacteria bacterium]